MLNKIITIIGLILFFIIYSVATDTKIEKNYFSNNFDSIYKSISYDERKILDNTFVKIEAYINDYGMIEYGIQKELFKYFDKEELSLIEQKKFNKLYYLSLRDIHDLKLLKYDDNLGIDNEVYEFLETIVNY